MNDFKKIKYIKMDDFISIFKFILVLPVSILFKIYNKIRGRKLWLVSELKDTARDNGYHFFKYVRENHPNDFCYYVINKKSKDYEKVKKYGNIIEYYSLKYWLYYMSADKNIITNKAMDPSHVLFYVLHKYLNIYNNCIFIQHGIIKDDIPMFYYKNAKFRLFICGAKREYEYVLEKFGYPKNYVKYTGLSRFDNLHDNNIKTNQILIMPTWRNWLGRDMNFFGKKENFVETDYFKNWNGLLNNVEFIKYIEEKKLIVKFYPHYQMHQYLQDFKCNSKNIIIVDNDKEDIQMLLKESAILITDFSSVYMDFAYMEKPIIYYQFDKEKYRKLQLQQGYFEYERDGFGKVCESREKLIKEFEKFDCEFKPELEYLKRMKKFFELKDSKNSERIYNEIKKIE